MSPFPPPETEPSSALFLTRVDELLEQADSLAKNSSAVDDYYLRILGGLAEILNAEGVAVWSLQAESVSLLFDTKLPQDSDVRSLAQQVIAQLEPDRTVLLPPHATGRLANPTPLARCIACVTVASQVRLALDVRLSAVAQRGENIADVVSAVAHALVEFHRIRQLDRLTALISERDRLSALCFSLHATLDRQRLAAVLSNDGASALKVDRISVLLANGSEFRLVAATAVPDIHPRANATRSMEQLVGELHRRAEPLPWTMSDTADEVVRSYLNDFGAKHLRVEWLKSSPSSTPQTLGAVVLEMFEAPPPNSEWDVIAETCRHAEVALTHATAFANQSWGGHLFRWRSLAQSQRARTIAGIVCAILCLLWIVPARLQVEAQGQVQPVRRQHLYAPADGMISEVAVANGARVAAGDLLLTMRDPQLDLEEQRIRGEIATTNARLAAVQAARIEHDRRGTSAASLGQLTAEEEEHKQKLASLNRQLEIIQRRVAELSLRAPLAGQVVRWDLVRSLESRPVRQGQLLLQIVDPSGPWQLELRIPDRQVRHVLAARAATPEAKQLPVRFLFRMAPKTTYTATLKDVSLATDLDPQGELSSLATVTLDSVDIPDLRPGSSVIAKIDCGWHSLGYVWLRELLEFLQIHLLF